MKRSWKLLASRFALGSKFPLPTKQQTTSYSSSIRSFSTNNNNPKPPSNLKNNRDSLILEQFRSRQQKGCVKADQFQSIPGKPTNTTSSSACVRESDEKVVSGFKGLGLREELITAAEELGFGAPSEIQCVGIPAILDGKCVVLSSESGSARSLVYLMPLVQLLRRDEASVSMKPKQPRAIVLCTTEELSDECFRLAKSVSDHARSKSSMNNSQTKSNVLENSPGAPIGMLVGTPSEIFEQMKESYVLCNDIKYLVLDEADAMLSHGFGPTIQKIINQIGDRSSVQTILVTSPVTEMLDKKLYPLMECLGKNHAGEVAALMLEMDRREAFDLLESSDALKTKIADAMVSLRVDAQGS